MINKLSSVTMQQRKRQRLGAAKLLPLGTALLCLLLSGCFSLRPTVDEDSTYLNMRSYQEFRPLIEETAKRHQLPSGLLAALVMVESGFRPDVIAYEGNVQKYFYHPDPRERSLLSSSIGLGQVVYGFHRQRCALKSARDLINPRINLNCTAMVLGDCLARQKDNNYNNRLRGALVCYNGSNTYPDKIFAAWRKLKRLK